MLDVAVSRPPSPWHVGERAVQRLAGVPETVSDRAAAAIRDHLREQHQQFFPLLPFAVLGTVDPDGRPWATLQAGAPGFLSSPDPLTLEIGTPRTPSDPADAGMDDGDAVGLLGIDLLTRRRNRLNGTVRRGDADGYAIAVEQSFGNCNRFILPRQYRFVRPPTSTLAGPIRQLDGLDEGARSVIAAAATFFVASYMDGDDGHRQVDVSHRGGPAGFVSIDADGVLTIPDYAGNGFFNTLGNLRLNGRAGLLFVDFSTGDLLQLTGDAELQLGEERSWRVKPRRVVLRQDAVPLRWQEG